MGRLLTLLRQKGDSVPAVALPTTGLILDHRYADTYTAEQDYSGFGHSYSLTGSPTRTNDGLVLNGSKYLLASGLYPVNINGDWSMYFLAEFNGSTGYIAGLFYSPTNGFFASAYYNSSGNLGIVWNGASTVTATGLLVPTSGFVPIKLTHDYSASTLRLTRLDTSASINLTSNTMSARVIPHRFALGCRARSSLDAITNGLTVKNAAIYDRLLDVGEEAALVSAWESGLNAPVGSLGVSVKVVENSGTYDAFGRLMNPTGDDLVYVARRAAGHTPASPGNVVQWNRTSGAWAAGTTIYDDPESSYDARAEGGGRVPSTGTLVVFPTIVDNTIGHVRQDALRSTDGGANWSVISDLDVKNGSTGFYRPFGPLVELPSGKILVPMYGDAGAVWVIESTDDGLTWSVGATIQAGGAGLATNETALAITSVGADDASTSLIAVSREGANQLRQYTSTDGGATWSYLGLVPHCYNNDVSPELRTLSGGDVLLTWTQRGLTPQRTSALRADASEVMTSVNAWRAYTPLYDAVTSLSDAHGYLSFVELSGGQCVGVLYDNPVGSPTSGSDTDLREVVWTPRA